MGMVFNTYHWWGCPLGDDGLERARGILSTGVADEDAFLALLRGETAAAVGTALDHYHHGDTAGRHGAGNPFSAHEAEVLEHARRILGGPPSPRSETGAEEDGADHASALLAMMNLAAPEDAGIVASALRNAPTVNVRSAAVMAAGTVLARSGTPNQDLVSALSSVVSDGSRTVRDRVRALTSLSEARSEEAAEIISTAMASDDVELQTEAALLLASRYMDTHRGLIERVAGAWPEDAPYPAEAVRDLLRAAEAQPQDPDRAEGDA